MIVTFCGHRSVYDKEQVKKWLIEILEDLILKGARTFYLGGYGEFDILCKNTLLLHKKKYPKIKIILVVPYINHKLDTSGYDGTVYPDLEHTPPQFAIIKRNQYMVDISDCIVTYVIYKTGGAHKTLEYATRKNKTIFKYL